MGLYWPSLLLACFIIPPSLKKSLFVFALVVIAAVAAVVHFVRSAPPLPEAMCADLFSSGGSMSERLVHDPKQSMLNLWNCMCAYKNDHWWHTTVGIWGIYFAFKVVGPLGSGSSVLLSILIGALYDEYPDSFMGLSMLAHFLVVSAEVVGGLGGFLLFRVIGSEISLQFMAEKMKLARAKMDSFNGSLFRYVLFLRLSPLFPNWFVSYSSGVLGIPSFYYLVASTLAIQPASCVSTGLGAMLRDVGNTGLDLSRCGEFAAQTGAAMLFLSFPLVPGDDWVTLKNSMKAVLCCCRRQKSVVKRL